MVTAYVKGINQYIEGDTFALPVEHRLLGIEPTPWTEEDVIRHAFLVVRYCRTYVLPLCSFWNTLTPHRPGK